MRTCSWLWIAIATGVGCDRQIARGERALEQRDALHAASLAQTHRCIELEQRVTFGARQRARLRASRRGRKHRP